MPQRRRIHSANDEFQLALSLLANRTQRTRQRRFFVEGVRPIDQAVAHEWPIDSLWYAAGSRLSGWAGSLVESDAARAVVEVAPALMAELSGKEETSELMAIVDTPPDDLARLPALDDLLLLAFDRPVSPGNLGSAVRSADALNGHGVLVTGHAADLYDPQAVRASMGSLFAIPAVRAGAMGEVAVWIDGLRSVLPGLQVVGSSGHASVDVASADLRRPTVLVVGNETRGLSHAWRELCDELVTIPMGGSASSLNAAAAAAVLLYEADRQRRGSQVTGPAA